MPFLVFCFGVWYFCLRILGTGLEFIPGDLGDSRFINFLLEHGYHWMRGEVGSFWQASFWYPFEHNVAISDNMLGTLPLYSFWRLLGAEQETAYQLWWIALCALNYWTAYIVLKKWFKNSELAIAGAWIFAFTIFNMGQLNYMQMIIRFMVPIVIYSAAKWVDTGKFKYFAGFSTGIVIQYYCVIYTGIFLMYFSLGFILIYTLITRRFTFFVDIFRRENLIKTSIVSLLCLGAMLWLMIPYMEVKEIMGYREYEEVSRNIPLPESYLFPHRSSWMWNDWCELFRPDIPTWYNQYNFMGMIPILTLLLFPFIWLFRYLRKIEVSKVTLGLGISASIILALYIRSEDFTTLYYIVYKLPAMESIRVVPRFIHVELFLLIALFISLIPKFPQKLAWVVIVIAFFDNSFWEGEITKTEKKEIIQRREKTIAEVKPLLTSEHVAFAIVDTTETWFITHVDAMNATFYVDRPTINGYSSTGPGKMTRFSHKVDREGLNIWLDHYKIPHEKVLVIER